MPWAGTKTRSRPTSRRSLSVRAMRLCTTTQGSPSRTWGGTKTLRGHFARANPVWKSYSAETDVLAVFQGPQAYVTPSWYPTKQESGKVNKIVTTTMGSSTDLANEGLRRLVVNGVFWGLGLDVPVKADVAIVGEFAPTMYGFGSYKKGVKPADLR